MTDARQGKTDNVTRFGWHDLRWLRALVRVLEPARYSSRPCAASPLAIPIT